MSPALYAGTVIHQRLKPTRHRLKYRLFWMLFDLDALPALSGSLRLFSHNRFNLLGFADRDHLDPTGEPLRAQVGRITAAAGIDIEGGSVGLLCMPRVLGFVFNPISVYFCRDADSRLVAMLYEVNNTFGQRHSYLIPVQDPAARVIRQDCEKRLYVSPFMEMAMTYQFRVIPPDDIVAVAIRGRDADGPIIDAFFTGRRQALSDGRLLKTVLTHGLLTVQVVVAIHWEAAKLWLKGLRLKPRPNPPDHPVTVASFHKG